MHIGHSPIRSLPAWPAGPGDPHVGKRNRATYIPLSSFFAKGFEMQGSSSGSLRMGSRGPAVSALQSKLNAALSPSPNLVADGVFGMKTAQAVKLFQQRKGLAADGIVGPKTAAVLGLSPGGTPGPAPGGSGTPATPPVPGTPPGGEPPGFVDLSIFNVVIEAVIGGYQKIAARLLSWIDSDYVPQFAYDRAASLINGAVNALAASLRGITRNVVPFGQDPAAYVTGRIREILAVKASALSNALQPLTGLPVIGSVAQRYQRVLSGFMSVADAALSNLRSNGQSAQATASRIAAALEGIARQIG